MSSEEHVVSGFQKDKLHLLLRFLPFKIGFVNCTQLTLLKPLYVEKAMIQDWISGMLFVNEYKF